MNARRFLNNIPEEEKTPLVIELIEILHYQKEVIQSLKDEIARLKGQKPSFKIFPSKLEDKSVDERKSGVEKEKRPGSAKKKKCRKLEIHEEKIIRPDDIPKGSKFKGFQDYTVQDLVLRPYNIKYRLERWQTPIGDYLVGKLPDEVSGTHFGYTLRGFILYQYYQAHVTQPLILEELNEMNIYISSGQINRILTEGKESFHREKEKILEIGLTISDYINVDDTGARHDGKNGYCTHIGSELFAYFESSESKSRINFLKLLRGRYEDYVLSADAFGYMKEQKLPQRELTELYLYENSVIGNDDIWGMHLDKWGITNARHIRIATEGALLGSILEHGINPRIVIVSDDAGQFNILLHALCWIHAERGIQRIRGSSDKQAELIEAKSGQIWNFYADLKSFKTHPNKKDKMELEARFDEIFTEKTCYISLNKALERIYGNKEELLMVLERPEIPLHNNLSENDIREYVKRRKISGSTRSIAGRQCRDTFTSLKKTCRKLKISFWDYLMDRLRGLESFIPYLPDLIKIRSST